MQRPPARVLVVDDLQGELSRALGRAVAGHDVEVARDAVEGLHRIDCAGQAHDVIFCAVTGGDLSGPELLAYLLIRRARAAQRLVFVALEPPSSETRALLQRFPNPCIELRSETGAPKRRDARSSRRHGARA
jgi:hypothetical protein